MSFIFLFCMQVFCRITYKIYTGSTVQWGQLFALRCVTSGDRITHCKRSV